MNVVDLARLQFAVTATLHFLFVAVTLGLVTVVALMQTRAARTADPGLHAERMRRVRFWGGLYVINYALGIVSGLTQEFQFGLNWSGLSHVLGNVVGAPLAIETIVAFFLESTFLGLWAFGFKRVRPRVHLALIWGVTLTAYASTFWIMVVNGFMQKPVGYAKRDGVAYVTDWGAILTNGATWYAVFHIIGAVALLAGLILAAVSAHHLRRGRDTAFFRPTLRQGSLLAGVGAVVAVSAGFIHLDALKSTEPEKWVTLMGETGEEVDKARGRRAGRLRPGRLDAARLGQPRLPRDAPHRHAADRPRLDPGLRRPPRGHRGADGPATLPAAAARHPAAPRVRGPDLRLAEP
ncbi:hypothetical protein GCM10020221_10900 [Streptomyces thioluteus]|uniref:Cytochrome ubiquinol oxidase subunit I n=1 Tax=Streptomyces thioluteus TaxID=66431 RepID=A0ABN3WHZ0_STRTU